MKNGRTAIGALAAAVLAVGGLAAGVALTLPANATTTPAAGSASVGIAQAAPAKPLVYVVLNCNFKPVAEPSTYVLTCADAGIGLKGQHWTSWTSHLASGYGTLWENNCTPNCADGKIIDYPALVTLWEPAALKGHPGDRQYTELTVIFPSGRPPVYVRDNGKVVKTFPLTQTFKI